MEVPRRQMAFLLALTLSPIVEGAPQTFSFDATVGTRYALSAEIPFPAGITFRLPLRGRFTVDAARVDPTNTSGLAFLGRYGLLDGACVFEMEGDGGLNWAFGAVDGDVLGPGAEQKNDLRIVHGREGSPDEMRFQFWDAHPAQQTFSYLGEGEAGRLILTAVMPSEGGTALTGIEPVGQVPEGWVWKGDLAYITLGGTLLYGFQFDMTVTPVVPEFGPLRIVRGPEGGIEIRWDAEAGYTYELESGGMLGEWQPAGDFTGDIGERVTPIEGAGEGGYFRIRRRSE